jgi:hypothetical protein
LDGIWPWPSGSTLKVANNFRGEYIVAAATNISSPLVPAGSPLPPPAISYQAANIVAGRYIYLGDLLEFEECIERQCPAAWPICPSPIKLANWDKFLRSHPDQKFAMYIHSGLSNGFRIGFNRLGQNLASASRNHPSAASNPLVVSEYVRSEVSAGRLVGPLPQALLPFIKISPIGLVPKAHQPGKWRMIVDLSFPFSHSVNTGISEELSSITYAKVDDAVACIQQLGRGATLVKLDLQNAYRIIPVHPHDQHLLGIAWEGETFIDRALPFGLRSAPKIFSAVADMMAWALHWAGIRHLIHYLDDFLLMGAPDSEEGAQILDLALRTFQLLGIPVAAHKTEGPATLVIFLGILLDTIAQELRLPIEKIERLKSLLRKWSSKKACTRKELQSFLGHLSHAASVVRPGRTFLRELFNLLHRTKAPHHHIRLTAGARADMAWWKCFLQHWNGSSFFPPPNPSVHVFSDASGSYGCGAFSEDAGWFKMEWPEDWLEVDISVKELVPVVVAAAIWGGLWAGKHICFHVDNMAVVAVLNSRTAKDPRLMHLLRCFSFYSGYFRFHFSAVHIPGVMNTAADALSRNNLSLFSSLVPQILQFTVPPSLHHLLIATRPDWGSSAWTGLFMTSLSEVLLNQH